MAPNPNSDVYGWKQNGRLSIWRYLGLGRRSLDWHMAADSEGLSSLESLLRSFEGLDDAVCRSLAITSPSRHVLGVPNIPDRGILAPRKLRLSYDPSCQEGWLLPLEGEPLSWCIGPSGLFQFLEFLDGTDAFFDMPIGRNPSVWWWGTHGFAV